MAPNLERTATSISLASSTSLAALNEEASCCPLRSSSLDSTIVSNNAFAYLEIRSELSVAAGFMLVTFIPNLAVCEGRLLESAGDGDSRLIELRRKIREINNRLG